MCSLIYKKAENSGTTTKNIYQSCLMVQMYANMFFKRTFLHQQPCLFYVILIFFVLMAIPLAKNDRIKLSRFSVHTPTNNYAMRKFSRQPFSYWNLPDSPVDLSPFEKLEDDHCIIFLNNFLNVPVGENYPPMLTRRLVPARIIDEYAKPEALDILESKEQLTWWMESVGREHDITECLLFNQTGIRLLQGFARACFQLDFFHFIQRSKPWNCEVVVDLSPPFLGPEEKMKIKNKRGRYVVFLDTFQEMPIWYRGPDEGREYKVFTPSTIPQLHFFLVSSLTWETMNITERNYILTRWILLQKSTYYLNDNSQIAKHFAFMIAYIAPRKKDTQIVSVEHLAHFHYLQDKSDDMHFYHKPVFRIDMDNIIGDKLIDKALSSVKTLLGSLGSQDFPCKDFLSFGRPGLKKMTEEISESKDLMGQVILHVLGVIMGNRSNMFRNSGSCEDGMLPVTSERIRSEMSVSVALITLGRPLHTALQVSDSLSGFHYVTCRYRVIQAVAFASLVDIYDWQIWFLIGLSVLITGTVVTKVTHMFRTGHPEEVKTCQIFSVVKVLLEGGGFPSQVLNQSTPIQIILGAFMLMSIVLSNGYRNENVYSMIAPRKPIKYEKFQKMFQENIAAYTFTEIIRINSIPRLLGHNPKAHNLKIEEIPYKRAYLDHYLIYDDEHEGHNKSALDFLNWICSRSSILISDILSQPFFTSKKDIEMNDLVFKNSGIFPRALNKLIESSKTMSYATNNSDQLQAKQNTLEQQYYVLEKRILLDKLKDKEKVALILPWKMAKNVTSLLRKHGAYMGKEKYRGQLYDFEMEGFVLTSFLRRLANFKETGIIHKWMEILETIYISNSTALPQTELGMPERASMEGNVVIVLFVLGAGAFTALLGFLSEILVNVLLRLHVTNISVQCIKL